MALTGLEIYKLLPKTNCGDCGVPTCLAFAMKLAAGGVQLDACPHVSEEAKAQLAEASAPPMRAVVIGQGESSLKIGEELVLFRHEKTFFNKPGFAILIEDEMSEPEIEEKLEQLKTSQFDRIGELLKADLIAVRAVAGDADKFAKAVEKVKEADFPLILMSEDASVVEKVLPEVASKRPLIYAATEANFEAMANLAKNHDLPLAVKADSLEALSQLTEKINKLGVKELVLDPGSCSLQENLKKLVFLRRAALIKKFRPLGYPTIVIPADETRDEMVEALHAAIYVMKYGGIIVLKDLPAWKALPLFVLRQNIYTDPQRPMQVEEGFYEFNNPDSNAPVLVTTNFSLTYFIVSSEIETSKAPAWLGVVDVEGLSVLTAWAAGKFIPERIANFIKKSGIEQKIKHRQLVIPGYVAQISGELEDELGGWQVKVGPREAADIPTFLKEWSS
jgi:acetyl-CoA decarbonylase/synthase complex subunit gamma